MIVRVALLVLLGIGIAFANDPSVSQASLTKAECPYPASTKFSGTAPTCQRMTWTDEGTRYSTLVAVFKPSKPEKDAPAVVYIPGGPGDAPVTADGNMDGVLSLFPGRTVITLNPRGVDSAEPRPRCSFDRDFWQEDIEPKREAEITTTCRDAVRKQGIDLAQMDAPYLAKDISRLIRALGVRKAGIFGVSYGTESSLHLLAEKPGWLAFAVLDSVSLPGVLGIQARLDARDRFLGTVDRLCFQNKECPASITNMYPDLMAWTAQFEKNPVEIRIGPHREPWSLDAMEMLEFLASLTSYPDGAGYAPVFIEAFEDNRRDTQQWISTELESSFDYALGNFALLYGAYGDSAERYDPPPKSGDTVYPFDDEEYQDYAKLFRLWNIDDRTEEPFVTAEMRPELAGVPVLILSGGADTLTPVEWSVLLGKRFSGMSHFVFPDLGHAVAFGTDSDVNNRSVARQLRCGPQIVREFVAGKGYGACSRYLRKPVDE